MKTSVLSDPADSIKAKRHSILYMKFGGKYKLCSFYARGFQIAVLYTFYGKFFLLPGERPESQRKKPQVVSFHVAVCRINLRASFRK